MALVARFFAYFENGAAFASYTYDDTDLPNPRVQRFNAQNNASQDMRLVATRASNGAQFDLICEPGFAREQTLANNAAQRIRVDISAPSKPRLIGVTLEAQYPYLG